MKRALITLLVITLIVGMASLTGCKTKKNNDDAEKDKKKNRYITVINQTGKTINEVHVLVGEGTEIDSASQENPDKESFSIKIPNEYDEYEDVTVKLVSNHGLDYITQKEVPSGPGRTEVVVKKSDYKPKRGDAKRLIDDAFDPN